MADPIVAPDVATNQPDAAPDLTPVTGGPANPVDVPAPAGSAVIPPTYTSGAPVAQPAPKPEGGFMAGVNSAAPQYSADENGNITQSNPTPKNFKGILGNILGSSLRGAAYGMAAEKGESGAAAAQRLKEAADERQQQIAQRNLENKRQHDNDVLNHALITAHTVSLQQRLAMEEESHRAAMIKAGFENDELLRQHRANDQAEKNAMADARAELIAHGVAPIHELTPDKSASAGSVANLKSPAAKQSVLAQMTTHAANIANGKLMPLQNGKDGDDSGIDLYNMDDLNKPIQKSFFYSLPTGLTNPDGTPVMTPKVITPNGKTTYAEALSEIHGANARLDQENKRLSQIEERKKATLEQQNEAQKPELTKADINLKKSEAAEHYANAAAARAGMPGGTGAGSFPPQGYAPPTTKELMTLPLADLHAKLKAAGAPEVPYLGTLVNVARNDTPIETAFTNTKRKGVSQTDRELAEDYITKWLDPHFNAGTSNARTQFIRGWSNGTSGDGASIRRMNTAVGHLGLLGQAAQVLAQDQGGSSLPFLNNIAENYGLQTGSDPTLVYKAIANKAAAEAASAVKGGSGSATDQEIEKAAQGFNPAWAPQQQASWLRSQMQILAEADSTLRQVFYDNMQRTPEEAGRSILSPKNQQIMNQWVNSGSTPTGNAVNPNAAQSIGGKTAITPAAQAVIDKYKNQGNLNNR